MTLDHVVLNLAVALALGGAIGFERQWRQRLAGLRTNTLVCLGAASFVVFEAVVGGEPNPTRVAAQVVSGIGFLGAGVIFREGLSVRGLNTAATLWCSSAVGVLAGAGYAVHAAAVTAGVIFVNLLLRPLVQMINKQPLATAELETQYSIKVTCRSPDEAHIRALLLQSVTNNPSLTLRRLVSSDVEGTGQVEVVAALTAMQRSDSALEQIVGRLSLEPALTAAGWDVETVQV